MITSQVISATTSKAAMKAEWMSVTQEHREGGAPVAKTKRRLTSTTVVVFVATSAYG